MSERGPLIRPDFASCGAMLGAADFSREQAYHRTVQALRCSSLHTPGVVAGLTVSPIGPQQLRISPGMAILPDGRQIVLAAPTTIDLAEALASTLYLTIAPLTRFADWTTNSHGAGYTGIVDDAEIGIAPDRPLPGGEAIILARILLSPERRLLAPDLAVREEVGVALGRVDMPAPDDAQPSPAFAPTATGDALVVTAPLTDLFGSLHVQGRLEVGRPLDESAPRSALSVRTPVPTAAAGSISSRERYILGTDAYDLASLSPGDHILVPTTAGGGIEQDIETLIVETVVGRAVTVVTPPTRTLVASPFAIVRRNLLQLRHRAMALAVVVSIDGGVGIGGVAASPGLSIAAGDMRLEGHKITFDADGTIGAGAGRRGVRLSTESRRLEVRDAGTISFAANGQPSPGLHLSETGNVGVGTAAPAQRLSVDGIVQARGGVTFPDGTHQDAGVVAIPIGTVIIWWRATDETRFVGEGFQLCDGSTITDAASPLVGQKTPDLNGSFVRGAVSYEQIGQKGGAPSHAHDVVFPQHVHDMQHFHPISGTTTGIDGREGYQSAGSRLSSADHIHSIDADSGAPEPYVTGANPTTPTSVTASADNLPPYTVMLRAMRIK